jgi:hypothetical protein
MSPIYPPVLATKLVVEKPVRRATKPASPTNWGPRRPAVRHGLAFHRELLKLAKKSRTCEAASGQSAARLATFEAETLRFLTDRGVCA